MKRCVRSYCGRFVGNDDHGQGVLGAVSQAHYQTNGFATIK